MKKLLGAILALVLVLGVCACAQAAPFYLESAGVTIEVPDGMSGQDMSDDETAMLVITDDADPNLGYAYVVRYLQELEGKYLEDLTDEEAQNVGMSIGASIENAQLDSAEVNGYPVLVVVDGAGTQLHYISLLNGWLCDVAVMTADGSALEEAAIAPAADLLTSITFDEADE